MTCRRVLLPVLAGSAWLLISRPATAAPLNPIQKENAQPGTSAWQLTDPADARQIEGYASLTSVPAGGDISLFVNTRDAAYTMTIYRMGWYGGKGGRKVLGPQTLAGVQQPIPAVDPTRDLIECHWTHPFVLHVPASWLSGVYLAKLHGNTSGKESYVVFTVRDSRRAELVFQQSVTSYEAYNPWPGIDPSVGRIGQSLYPFGTQGDAQVQRVSFNRPYAKDTYISVPYAPFYGVGAGDFLYNVGPVAMEYSMVRWLERGGYDVTYITDVDTHEDVNRLLRARGFLSVGHDEYWSYEMKAHVMQARDRGVGLGFFGGNYMYWPIQLAPGFDGTPSRTIVLAPQASHCMGTNGKPNQTLCQTDGDCAAGDTCKIKDCDFACNQDEHGVSQTEQAIVGGMDEPGTVLDIRFGGDIVVTDDARLDHWVFANTGLNKGDVIPGLVGIEYNSTIRPEDWFPGNTDHPDYPLPPGLAILLHTQAPNFESTPGTGGFSLPDDFDGKDFNGWYEAYLNADPPAQLDSTCDRRPIPPLNRPLPEGFCRNPFPYWWGQVRDDWAMTTYQAPSGAWVFNAATNNWSWGLDDYYTGIKTADGVDNGPALRTQCGYPFFHPDLVSCKSPALEQITRNVLDRFIAPLVIGH